MDYKNDKHFTQEAIDQATSMVRDLTPSVLVVARLLDVKPDALATALYDGEAQGIYTAKLTSFLIDRCVKEAYKELKNEKKSE